jgi:hypothetical protein
VCNGGKGPDVHDGFVALITNIQTVLYCEPRVYDDGHLEEDRTVSLPPEKPEAHDNAVDLAYATTDDTIKTGS